MKEKSQTLDDHVYPLHDYAPIKVLPHLPPCRECGVIGGDLIFLKGYFPYCGTKIFGLIPSYPYLPLPKKVGFESLEDKK